MPSSSSAERPVAVPAARLTVRGGWFEPTCRARAAHEPCLTSVLTVWATFLWPSLKKFPSAPSAVLATPNTNARITAKPTRKTVALPTHITFENTHRTISLLLSRRHTPSPFYPTLRGDRLPIVTKPERLEISSVLARRSSL